jgi:hypothetical protein
MALQNGSCDKTAFAPLAQREGRFYFPHWHFCRKILGHPDTFPGIHSPHYRFWLVWEIAVHGGGRVAGIFM